MEPNKFETNLHQYLELRTILDSLAIGVLRYYLDAYSPQEQEERFYYLTGEMKKIVEPIWKEARAKLEVPGSCPHGYMECYGVCVPYNCVG